ncbi:MAG: hypothetical protein ACYC5M_08685 [Anaerolineae bacterium]
MQLCKLDTSRPRDVRRFVNMPFAIYQDCPQWVPSILPEIKAVLNRRTYPFYQHSEADFFVVESGKETLGRIAVMENTRHNAYRGRNGSIFYLFESVDDVAVSNLLFDAALDWSRRRGLNEIVGPKGFLQADGIGMLVEGFEHRPAVGIPYNHAYYDALARTAGFQKVTDWISGYLDGAHELSPRFYEVAEKVKEKRSLSIKSFASAKELRAWVPRIGEVYNEAFLDNLEFCPVTDAEMKAIGERLVAIADPRLIKLVIKGDAVIGFVFAFPDISAAIQKTKGRVWPLGWLSMMRESKATKWVNCNGTGLLPAHRGVGANAVLYTELAKTIRDFGFQHADVVQIEEQNTKSLGDMTAIGVQWYKRHRLYARPV